MEDKELKKKVNQAKATANAEMVADVLARNEADAAERTSLQSAQDAEMAGLQQNNQAQYSNLGQIVSDVEGKISAARQLDETAQRRENAYRYISGLGDTLSGVANLIGTANGAANQQQTYNSNAVVQKAEEARKARKIEIEDLSKRLDEMKARQRDIQAAGSLAEAQLKAKQSKEMAQLQSQQRAKADEAKRYADTQAHTAMREARADWEADRTFAERQRQFDEEQQRLETQNRERLAAEKEIAEAKAAAERAKQAMKPEQQAAVLRNNVTGVRDELARKMGYADYNEYLRYQNVSGWGTDIDGQRNKDSKAIRKKRADENPETEEFLNLLKSPEDLTEEQISMLVGASDVFADAIKNSGAEVNVNPTNGKKKVW